jgi:hypothetical protein
MRAPGPTSAPASVAPPTPTAAWPGGPTTARKSTSHSFADYLGWVRQVEAAYPDSKQQIVQRLRKVYYSGFTAAHSTSKVGSRFDKVIESSVPNADAPLSSPPLPLAALNGLYETDFIVTPSGKSVDVSHIWAGIDVSMGQTDKASTGALWYGVSWPAVLTWAGDLASWFVEWLDQRQAAEAKTGAPMSSGDASNLLFAVANSKVAKDDLLGDLDAQALAGQYIKMEVVDPVALGEGFPGIDVSLTASASEMLEAYYKPKAGPAGELNRFASFVLMASPPIPHSLTPGPPPTLALGGDAKDAIYAAVRNTIELFLKQGTKSRSAAALKTYDSFVWNIAWYFTNFLTVGLAKGDAPWP